jgi:Amt family ammonium transporter
MDQINLIDTVWVLISSALVMLMIPGLGFFYGGLVRQKNVLSTIMHSIVMLFIITLLWSLVGYSLAFGESLGGIIGSFEFFGLRGVGLDPNTKYAPTIPHQAFMIFQMMFAAITPALISGAFAERKKFNAFLVFSCLWVLFVYCPVAHWVWSQGGWLNKLGVLDFAGGIVVHLTSGISALVCALVLGHRQGFKNNGIAAHNITLTILGMALLWFGWYGFNSGSALAMNKIATAAFFNTHLGAAAGATMWMAISWYKLGQPRVIGAASGIVAGLAAVTPAVGFITPLSALIIGFIAGAACYFVVEHLVKGRVDDSLDVFGIHGIGGIIGVISLGIFATTEVNPSGTDGLLAGNVLFLGKQLIALIVVSSYAALVSFILLKLVDIFIGLRVSTHEEKDGLDLTQHGEAAYVLPLS